MPPSLLPLVVDGSVKPAWQSGTHSLTPQRSDGCAPSTAFYGSEFSVTGKENDGGRRAAGAKLRHYILHHHALIPVHVEEINLSLARIAMGSGVDLKFSIRWMDRRVGGRLRGNLGILSGAITLMEDRGRVGWNLRLCSEQCSNTVSTDSDQTDYGQ